MQAFIWGAITISHMFKHDKCMSHSWQNYKLHCLFIILSCHRQINIRLKSPSALFLFWGLSASFFGSIFYKRLNYDIWFIRGLFLPKKCLTRLYPLSKLAFFFLSLCCRLSLLYTFFCLLLLPKGYIFFDYFI